MEVTPGGRRTRSARGKRAPVQFDGSSSSGEDNQARKPRSPILECQAPRVIKTPQAAPTTAPAKAVQFRVPKPAAGMSPPSTSFMSQQVPQRGSISQASGDVHSEQLRMLLERLQKMEDRIVALDQSTKVIILPFGNHFLTICFLQVESGGSEGNSTKTKTFV